MTKTQTIDVIAEQCQMESKSTFDLAEFQAEVLIWHRKQFPDLPPGIAWAKLEAELAELRVAVLGWEFRRSDENVAAVLEEAADVLITMLGVLRSIGVVGEGDNTFAGALADKWARVQKRQYAGPASATRVQKHDGEPCEGRFHEL